MKKTLLAGLFLVAGIAVNAQTASLTVAPDFTATDLNGVQHHLYEYLDAGKTVIIDISATWCGPCWSYHGTRALADFHDAYGPEASDQVVVLFIEGDPATSVESLYGTNTASDNSVTRGNWTNHSPYPIIDDTTGSISNSYLLQYFPTVVMICPDHSMKELSQPSAVTLRTQVNANCTTLTGVTDKGRPEASTAVYCEGDGNYSAKLKNLGTNKITSATVVLKENGNVMSTQTYTNTNGLNQFSGATINFPGLSFIESAGHTVEITSLNGLTTLPHPGTASEWAPITSYNAAHVGHDLTVNIYTDFYPSEASWEIRRNDNNALVANGGPYQPGTVDQYGGGGADANTIKSHTVTLPEGIDCYKVVLKDAFSDGWVYGANGQVDTSEFHGIKILNGETLVYEESVSTFTFATQTYSAALVSNEENLNTGAPAVTKAFTLYPNPTSGVLNIRTSEEVSIMITDMTGKTVFTAKGLNDGSSVNLSALQKGMYVATVNGASGQKSEKVIIN